MVLFKHFPLFGKRAKSIGPMRPSHEDVDVASLGLGVETAVASKKGNLKSANKGVGKSGGAKIEPVVGATRPAAAIKLSDDEQARRLAGELGNADAEKNALLADIKEMGTNLRTLLDALQQMQGIVEQDYDELDEAEKKDAKRFLDSLQVLVKKDQQTDKQAA